MAKKPREPEIAEVVTDPETGRSYWYGSPAHDKGGIHPVSPSLSASNFPVGTKIVVQKPTDS